MKYAFFRKLMKLLPVLVLVLILSATGVMATDTTFDTESFKGLVLTTTVGSDEVSVKLYNGYNNEAANLMTPVYTEETADGGMAYYYEVTAGGNYRCVSRSPSGNARYIIHRCIYMSAEEAATKTVTDVTPAKRSPNGWDPPLVYAFSDETMATTVSSKGLWPDYADVFTTPAFKEGRNPHMQTTQTELETFLAGLDGTDDDMYSYILGQSAGKTFNIPLVIFTKVDLSGAKTLEEAAALIKADSESSGKLTVHYQAQIHGSEPASCEGALAMIQRLDGTYGQELLDKMNIYVIPRLNPYGAYKSQRNTYTAGGDGVDPNGDFMRLRMVEPQLRQKALLLFDPDVAMDGHEYLINIEWVSMKHKDVMLAAHYLPCHTDDFRQQAKNLASAAMGKLDENGLAYGWYTDVVNNASGAVGSGNAAYRGVLHVLMESHGITGGRYGYERRVMGQVSVATGIFDYLSANAATVKSVVRAQKQTIIEEGKTYEESDQVVLRYEQVTDSSLAISGNNINLKTGKLTAATFPAKVWTTLARSRTAPTAYVIPAGESYTEQVLNLMDMQGISYSSIPAGSGIQLQRYTQVTLNDSGRIIEAGLTDEQQFSFPNGAYVFSMAQVNANILSLLMEPDVTQTTTNTLVQSGTVPITDGLIPIYRYIHDLNADGSVDYVDMLEAPGGLTAVDAAVAGGTGKLTGLDAARLYEYRAEGETEYIAVAAGATEITGLSVGKYYIRYAATETTLTSADAVYEIGCGMLDEYTVYLKYGAADDTGDGYTEETAVKTIASAYSQLDAIMAYAPAGSAGKIVLLDTYTLPNNRNDLPAHDYPVILSGKTGTEGFVYTGGSSSDTNIVAFNGDTTLTNLKLTLKGSSTYNYLSAMGHKLVVDTGVTCVANSAGAYFNINGGDYRGTFASTDVTVLSGAWRQIYAGNYASGTITGDVKLKVDGITMSRIIQTTYRCTIKGDIYMDLQNITGGTTIYGGATDAGKIKGDVQIRLGKNIGYTKLYASSGSSTMSGSLTVIADGVDLDGITIYGRTGKTTNLVKATLVLNEGKLSQVVDNFVCREDATIVLGCDQTEEITLSKSFGMDLNGCDAAGITVAEGYTLTVWDSATDDYTVRDDQGYGKLVATGNVVAGEGYVELNGSYHKFSQHISGVSLRPGVAGIYYNATWNCDEVLLESMQSFGVAVSLADMPKADFASDPDTLYTAFESVTCGKPQTSAMITNILKGEADDIDRAITDIYAAAYVVLKDGTVLITDNEIAYSLYDVVKLLDNSQYADALKDFYNAWESLLKTWDLENIGK